MFFDENIQESSNHHFNQKSAWLFQSMTHIYMGKLYGKLTFLPNQLGGPKLGPKPHLTSARPNGSYDSVGGFL